MTELLTIAIDRYNATKSEADLMTLKNTMAAENTMYYLINVKQYGIIL